MKKLLIVLSALALTVCLAVSAFAAQQGTANMSVSAIIAPAAEIAVTNMDFGTSDGTADSVAQSTVTVTAPAGAPIWITMNEGLHFNAFGAGYRSVSDGANNIIYGLFAPTGWEWGDYDFGGAYSWGYSFSDFGTGSPQSYTCDGLLVPDWNPNPSAGTYTDTVLVTLYY